MTTTVARSQEAQSYLDRVGAALADLPEEERSDLLDELGTHVDEIAAEGTSSLEARLGSPEDYAAELRASAGLPPARTRRHAVAHLRTRGQAWLARPFVASVWDFLGSLRPAWWVLRGWLVVAAVALLGGKEWSGALVVVPAGMLGWWMLAAVVASVQLGRGLLGEGRRARLFAIAVNILAVLLLLPVLANLSDGLHRVNYYEGASQPTFVEQPPSEGVYSAGAQVWNIYAYDSAGRMLHDVRLYDQDGNPLSLGLAFDPTKQQTLDAAGQKVDNAFPYRYLDPTTGEVVDPEAAPPIAAPPLLGVPAATAAPTAPTASTAPAATTPAPSPTAGKQ